MVPSSPRSNESLLQSSLDSLPCMLFFYFSLDRLTLQFSRDLRNLSRIDSNDQRPAAISRKKNLFVIKICIRLRGSKFNKISVSKGERDFPETVVAYTIDSFSFFPPSQRKSDVVAERGNEPCETQTASLVEARSAFPRGSVVFRTFRFCSRE